MQELKVKRIFLHTLIGSIAVSALLGIWAILAGDFGDFQSRILATTLTVVGTSILGLACGAFWESPKSDKGLKFVPIIGIGLTVLSALITLLVIWNLNPFQEKAVMKNLAVSTIFAFSLAQLSLLSLANLSQKFRWAITAAYVVVLSLASLISILIMMELPEEDGLVMRVIGVLAVIDAALTVMIPIFHRLSLGDFSVKQTTVEQIDDEIAKLKDELSRLEQEREEVLKRES